VTFINDYTDWNISCKTAIQLHGFLLLLVYGEVAAPVKNVMHLLSDELSRQVLRTLRLRVYNQSTS